MKKSPIIFCHYGYSKYLKYVFECVRISNPDTEIFLLGDDANKEVAAAYNITHVDFTKYDFGSELEVFDKIYQLITTQTFDYKKHGEDWNKFVFRKWFTLYNFLEKNNIESFWHFDSDNMIVSDLSTLEYKYRDIDCMEQCLGGCMKGFFSNRKIIKRYNDKINEVFGRLDFMESVKNNMKKRKILGCFSEMSIYEIFRKEEDFKSIRGSNYDDGSSFDDLLCRSQGLVMEKLPIHGDVKKVFMNRDGRFFCKTIEGDLAIQMHALNLSWMPLYLYRSILNNFKKYRHNSEVNLLPSTKTLGQSTLPLKDRLKNLRKLLKAKIRKIFRK